MFESEKETEGSSFSLSSAIDPLVSEPELELELVVESEPAPAAEPRQFF
jgi:hypothetical protein